MLQLDVFSNYSKPSKDYRLSDSEGETLSEIKRNTLLVASQTSSRERDYRSETRVLFLYNLTLVHIVNYSLIPANKFFLSSSTICVHFVL